MLDFDLVTDELRDSWDNGNRTTVIEEVGHRGGLRNAYEAAIVAVMLAGKLDERQRAVFLRMLKNQIG